MGSKRGQKYKMELEISGPAFNNEKIILPTSTMLLNSDSFQAKIKKKRSKNRVRTDCDELETDFNDELENGFDTGENIYFHGKSLSDKKVPGMPQKDLIQLLERINSVLPEDDGLAFKSRLEKLDWDEVAFKNYTVEECKENWSILLKGLRTFRVLRELVQDAKEYVLDPSCKLNQKKNTSSALDCHTKLNHKKNIPGMPSRPPSNYMLFYKNVKDKIMHENPGIEFGKLSHKISQLFKNLSQEKRAMYDSLALKAKNDYLEEMERFYEDNPDVPRVKTKKEKPVRVVEQKPRKPRTPFSLYYETQIALERNEEKIDKNKLREQCKKQWKNLQDKKKLHFIHRAEEEMENYQELSKAYLQLHPDYVPPTVKSVLTKEEKLLKERLQGKPVKPPNSAYSLFSKTMLQSDEIKKIISKDRMNFISNRWRNCSDEEKSRYKLKTAELTNKYKEDYEKYLKTLPDDERQKELSTKSNKRKVVDNEPKVSKRLRSKRELPTRMQEPKTPPISAYQYFASQYRVGNKSPKQAWKKLSEAEQNYYERQLMKIKQEYIVEFEKFLNSLTKEELEQYSQNKQMETGVCNDEDDDDDEDCSSTSTTDESEDSDE